MYRPSRFVGSAARLKVEVDSQFVGKTGSGTFMVIGLDPGHHRASAASAAERPGRGFRGVGRQHLLLQAMAQDGFMSAQSGIEVWTQTP